MSKDLLAAFPNLLLPVLGALIEPESPLLAVISEIRYRKKNADASFTATGNHLINILVLCV